MCDLGGASEIANYGEYSGAPSETQTYEYAKTILGLMTKTPNEKGNYQSSTKKDVAFSWQYIFQNSCREVSNHWWRYC